MYAVLLKDKLNQRAVRLYAAKVIYEEFLTHPDEMEEARRRLNLKNEIDVLKVANPDSSVTLIEFVQDSTRHIMIQEFLNGGNLNNVLAQRETTLEEQEI